MESNPISFPISLYDIIKRYGKDTEQEQFLSLDTYDIKIRNSIFYLTETILFKYFRYEYNANLKNYIRNAISHYIIELYQKSKDYILIEQEIYKSQYWTDFFNKENEIDIKLSSIRKCLTMLTVDELKPDKEILSIIDQYKNLTNSYPSIIIDGEYYHSNYKMEDFRNIISEIGYILKQKSLKQMSIYEYEDNEELHNKISLISCYYAIFVHCNNKFRQALREYKRSIIEEKNNQIIAKIKEKEERNKMLSQIAKEKYQRLLNEERDIIFKGKVIDIILYKDDFKIYYDNTEYDFDEFLITVYDGERKEKSIFFFPETIDKLLQIGPTLRIKLKAEMLSYFFGLAFVTDEETNALQSLFAKYYDSGNEDIREIYRRLWWKNGLAIMVTYGANLTISGKAKGPIKSFWCFQYQVESGKALFTGIETNLFSWLDGVKMTLKDEIGYYLLNMRTFDKQMQEHIKNACNKSLYYQNKKYLALPDIDIGQTIKGMIWTCIEKVCNTLNNKMSFNCNENDLLSIAYNIIDTYFKTFKAENNNYYSYEYQFIIDFEKDIKPVNKAAAARAQQSISECYKIAAERLKGLKAGDKVTTRELRERGYSNSDGRAINTLVKYKVLEKEVLRGRYIMLQDF